jgi:magnesium-transporting ATPase (P-type)
MEQPRVAIANAARWTRWIVVALIGTTILLQVAAATLGTPHLRLHPLGRGVAGAAVSLLHSLFMLLALVQLWLALRHVETGELFSAHVTRGLRRFALFTLLAVLSGALLTPLLIVLFPDCASPGPCARRLPIDMRTFWTLIIVLVFFLVARILDEARRVDEENKQII